MQATFNTKRLYTAEGQIITARYDAFTYAPWAKKVDRDESAPVQEYRL